MLSSPKSKLERKTFPFSPSNRSNSPGSGVTDPKDRSLGWSNGYHVFPQNDIDRALAKREKYKSVKKYAEDGGKDKAWEDVVALDCEVIHTMAGLTVARVTIIDTTEKVLLNEFVKPKQKLIVQVIGPETIIVGHGLENDLRALRLFHDQSVDTSSLFPHPRGLPCRRGLREVIKETLGYSIQDFQTRLGHNPIVDATAAVGLVRWKMLRRR
ncbi:hypothetical protein IAR50_000800 [Cryptococcus sp. DSM 104548]